MAKKDIQRISSITYSRTFNNGEGEGGGFSKIVLTADVYQEDNIRDVFDELLDLVDDFRKQERA